MNQSQITFIQRCLNPDLDLDIIAPLVRSSFFMSRSEVAATASIIVSFVPHSSTVEVILIVISSNNFTDGVE